MNFYSYPLHRERPRLPCRKPCIYYCLVLRCSSCKVLQISARFALSYKSLRRTCLMTTNYNLMYVCMYVCSASTGTWCIAFWARDNILLDKISQYRSPREVINSLFCFTVITCLAPFSTVLVSSVCAISFSACLPFCFWTCFFFSYSNASVFYHFEMSCRVFIHTQTPQLAIKRSCRAFSDDQ